MIRFSVVLALSLFSLAAQAQSPAKRSSKLRLNIIPAHTMCHHLAAVMKSHSSTKDSQSPHREARLIALNLVDQIRTGDFGEYIPYQNIAPTRAAFNDSANGFLSLADILKKSLGIDKNVILVTSTSELKFLPYVQQGSEIILIANSAKPLNAQRAKAVALTANRLKIHINTIWYGPQTHESPKELSSQGLAFITALTGGKFVNLGGASNPCITKS